MAKDHESLISNLDRLFEALEDSIEDLAGERMPIVLVIETSRGVEYISNYDRKYGILALRATIVELRKAQKEEKETRDIEEGKKGVLH